MSRRTLVPFIVTLLAVLVVSDSTQGVGGITMRASVASDGTEVDDRSFTGIVSGDGHYVLFTSASGSLVPGDTNGVEDVFVHDNISATTERVSIDSAEVEAAGSSGSRAISFDGRYVAFNSDANNLVPNDTNQTFDVFVRDRITGTTERVSVDTSGNEGNGLSWAAAITGNGRYVVLASEASNLVPSDTNKHMDVFIHDRSTGETERVSVDSAGNEAVAGAEGDAEISADGRYVVFQSEASDLVDGDTNAEADIFVRDRTAGITERVSVDSVGTQAEGGASWWADISAEGRLVSFTSYAGNLVPGISPTCNGLAISCGHVYVHDRATGSTQAATVSSTGILANSQSCCESISADGRFVAFYSYATNLVLGDASECVGQPPGRCPDAFVHDLLTGVTTLISVSADGGHADGATWSAAINADGRFVSFESFAANLVSDDTNVCSDQPSCLDVFVRDLGDIDGDGEWDPFDFGTDSDGDGVMNPIESKCASNPLSSSSTPERIDTTGDDDGDTLVNEALPPGTEPFDCDQDGFIGSTEQYVFSASGSANDQKRCGIDAWPADINNNGFSDILDIAFLTGQFGIAVPPASARYNVAPDPPDGYVDTQDIARMTALFGQSCA